jgi:hypothetical protein
MIDLMIYLRAECLLFQNAASSQPEFESSRCENAGADRGHLTGAASATGLTFQSTIASAEYAIRDPRPADPRVVLSWRHDCLDFRRPLTSTGAYRSVRSLSRSGVARCPIFGAFAGRRFGLLPLDCSLGSLTLLPLDSVGRCPVPGVITCLTCWLGVATGSGIEFLDGVATGATGLAGVVEFVAAGG